MYHHVKKLMYTVNVGTPDPRFGNMLLEQFGGANGELAAAMQYSIQGLNCDDPERKDLLMDIGTEELSHLEVVGTLARMHLKPTKSNREAAEADRGGLGPGHPALVELPQTDLHLDAAARRDPARGDARRLLPVDHVRSRSVLRAVTVPTGLIRSCPGRGSFRRGRG